MGSVDDDAPIYRFSLADPSGLVSHRDKSATRPSSLRSGLRP